LNILRNNLEDNL